MRIFTLYRNPSDFPGKIVVRGADITAEGIKWDSQPLFVGENIALARDAIQAAHPGAYPLGRDLQDDAVIEEVWL